jgi:uncharacterized protein YegL
MFLRVIEFGDGASYRDGGYPTPIEAANWKNLLAKGTRSDFGAALTLLGDELQPERLGPYQWPPILILLSHRQPTDHWDEALRKFNQSPYGMRTDRTVRVALAIGNDVNRDVLMQFTGGMETVFDNFRVAECLDAVYGLSCRYSMVEAPDSDGSVTSMGKQPTAKENSMPQFDTGSVARRKLHFFLLCDVSGSMGGAKIQSLNQVAESLIPLMNKVQAEQAQAEMFLRVIEFGEGAVIRDGGHPAPVDTARWENLFATGGRTDLGAALDLLTNELQPERLGPYQYPPCIIILSDGQPTDRWEEALHKFNQSPYGLKSDRTVRVAVAIGNDANRDVLMRFTGSMETVFDAYSAAQLADALRFVTVASLTNSIKSTGDGLNANASGEAFKAAASQFKAGAAAQRDPNDVIF